MLPSAETVQDSNPAVINKVRCGHYNSCIHLPFCGGQFTTCCTLLLQYSTQSTQSDGPVRFLIFCSISFPCWLAQWKVEDPSVLLGHHSRGCTPAYLSTGISNLLQPTQAEVVLGHLSTYLASWVQQLYCTVHGQPLAMVCDERCSHCATAVLLCRIYFTVISALKLTTSVGVQHQWSASVPRTP